VLDDLGEGRVRLALAGDAARLDVLEAAVEADGAARGLVADEPVEEGAEAVEVRRRGERPGDGRLEEGDDGERRARPGLDLVGPPVRLHLVEAAVEGDHLPVERLERPEAEIPAASELLEVDVPVVLPMKQGVDGRGLEEGVMGTSPHDEVLLLQVFDVQRAHERGIYGHWLPLGL
jgi:hypothetical protein